MHYLRAGQGEPLVLLHGWPQHSLMWRSIIPALAQEYTVIAPDLRGAGDTAVTPSGYDKRTMATDVRALITQLGLGKVSLVGHDHGAGVAYAYASMHRADVRRMAVLDFALPGFGYEFAMNTPPEADRDWNWQVAMFTMPDVAEPLLQGNERELLDWFFRHQAHVEPAVRGRDFNAYVRAISGPGRLRAGMNWYDAVWQDLADNRAFAQQKLTIPILALGGEASVGALVGQAFDPVGTDVRGGVVPAAGHWMVDENPAEVTRRLLDFFGSSRAEAQPSSDLKANPTPSGTQLTEAGLGACSIPE
jgi:pimeloyl-ACP methyl ester carboxylesterase